MRRPVKNRIYPKPDFKYNSLKVSQFVNHLMHDGKKTVAQKVMDDTFAEIKKTTKEDPLVVFETALRNVSPTMEVRSRRVGGANYQVPIEVRPERRSALSYRWIIDAARNKKGAPMYKRLAQELVAAYNDDGEAMKKKASMHRMAEANKAFAHFAFKKKKKKTLI